MLYSDVIDIFEEKILPVVREQYAVSGYVFHALESHEGGRNVIYIGEKENAPSYVLRISYQNDRTKEEYLAELEFVHYLAENGASVSDVIATSEGKLLCEIGYESNVLTVCLFEKAPGMQLAENNYQYREGAPLSEYFYQCGKTLGKIHALAKLYQPVHARNHFADKYNMKYINELFPETLCDVKDKIAEILNALNQIEKDKEAYGMVHFDYSDGNYNIDFGNGQITVYDFDNSCFAWYMYDLAELWVHGSGWIMFEQEEKKRKEFMDFYFAEILKGYRSETSVSDEMVALLPLFVQATRIENLVDAFEVEKSTGENYLDEEDVEEICQCILEESIYEN